MAHQNCGVPDDFCRLHGFSTDNAPVRVEKTSLHQLLLLRQVVFDWLGKTGSAHVRERLRELQAWSQTGNVDVGDRNGCTYLGDDRHSGFQLSILPSRNPDAIYHFDPCEFLDSQTIVSQVQNAGHLLGKCGRDRCKIERCRAGRPTHHDARPTGV